MKPLLYLDYHDLASRNVFKIEKLGKNLTLSVDMDKDIITTSKDKDNLKLFIERFDLDWSIPHLVKYKVDEFAKYYNVYNSLEA